MDFSKFAKTRLLAENVLDRNSFAMLRDDGSGQQKIYRWTVPSREYYVHQWHWDSCTAAMALVHVNPELAQDELKSLTAGQWPDGNIGMITYNPKETKYYSKESNWDTDRFAKGDFKSAGLSNPPLFGIAVGHVYTHTANREDAEEFLDHMLPLVIKFHDFLKAFKDIEDSGLLTYIHPWETGQDNSPRWDGLMERIKTSDIPQSVIDDVNTNRVDNKLGKSSHRPRQEEYYRYMYLVDLYNKWKWDFIKIMKETPFAVKDILSSGMWARANEVLADLLEERNQHELSQKYAGWAKQTQKALAETWSEEHQQYCDIDVSQGRWEPIVKATNAMFVALWGGGVTKEQYPKLLNRLYDPKEFWPKYPVPSTSLKYINPETTAYWRKPSWPITNIFTIEGLNRYLHEENLSDELYAKTKTMHDHLVLTTMEMIEEHGFYENYDPEGGIPTPGKQLKEMSLGFGDFSWSAATFIYLYEKYK